MAPAKDKDVVVQHKLETTAEWEAHTEAAAPKDWLYVVEIYAMWCGPTEAIHSTLKKLNVDYMGRRLKFFLVSAEIADSLEKYRLSSRPTFMLFKNGELLETIDGVNTPLLKKYIADHLADGIIDVDEVEATAEGEEEEY
ncbi:hypothetical protein T492DRAFT_1152100 [Pavlovales sp. CCMP2436]|nr:hypothetical protein T492DRAFT_1152100 [Pavlovales sp. CCMP2436]|mmetsp:Transcript_21311/g.54035  ORF Transcript_21311/g.54035 Transcript_21311/m.54035 type:complete len:140 (+) Transcript_21311:96-515(+)